MLVDKRTMLITDFGEYSDYHAIYKHVTRLSYGGQSEITAALSYLRPMFDEWYTECGLNSTQGLLVMSTVFPIRVLISLIEKGYVAEGGSMI